MTGLLASVCNTAEAQLALAGGADIVDCKDPHQGALGALPLKQIQRIVATVAGRRPVSATVGDIADPDQLENAIRLTRSTGVDYIKFGLFDSSRAEECLQAAAAHAASVPLIGVCFAERFDPLPLLPRMVACGLSGVMVDTADKHAGRLTQIWSDAQIQRLVSEAQQAGLLCGLAGRLNQRDIPALLKHGADYLGFRSALCGGDRKAELLATSMLQVRLSIPGDSHADERATA